MSASGDLLGGRALAMLFQQNAVQGSLTQKIIQAVNNLGRNVGASPTGQLAAPPPVNAIQVKASGGVAHVTITDNNAIQKPIHYFVEADTNPSFTQPHVEQLSASRGKFIPLPGMTDGSVAQPWHFRAYSQYPGSQPSQPVTFGGASGATPVDVGGAVAMTPLASTGSGTASPTGTQSGQGFGKTNMRPAQGPKRAAGQ